LGVVSDIARPLHYSETNKRTNKHTDKCPGFKSAIQAA